MTQLQAKIREFIVQQTGLAEDVIEVDTPLISSALIDSFLLVAIADFIEEASGVRIPDDFVTAENLDSLAQMQAMVDRFRNE